MLVVVGARPNPVSTVAVFGRSCLRRTVKETIYFSYATSVHLRYTEKSLDITRAPKDNRTDQTHYLVPRKDCVDCDCERPIPVGVQWLLDDKRLPQFTGLMIAFCSESAKGGWLRCPFIPAAPGTRLKFSVCRCAEVNTVAPPGKIKSH